MLDVRTHVEVATPSRETSHRARHHPRAGVQDVDDRVGALIGVWAVQHEEIREPADTHAEIGMRVQTPAIMQAFATNADDVEAGEIAAGFESCRQNYGVDVDDIAAHRDNRRAGYAFDRVSDEIDVGTLQRQIVLLAEQDTFAPEWIARCQRVS